MLNVKLIIYGVEMKKTALFTLCLFSSLSFARAMESAENDVNHYATRLASTADEKIHKLTQKMNADETPELEGEIIRAQINLLRDLLTSRELPEDNDRERQYKQEFTHEAIDRYNVVKELRMQFKKKKVKREPKEEKKKTIPTHPQMFRKPLKAPNVTWEDYENELSLNETINKSTVTWTPYGIDAFGGELQGKDKYRNLRLTPLTAEEEVIDLENLTLKLLAQQEPQLIGQYALAYKAEKIDLPFFLVAEDLMKKLKVEKEPLSIPMMKREEHPDLSRALRAGLNMDEKSTEPSKWKLVSSSRAPNIGDKPLSLQNRKSGVEIVGTTYTFARDLPMLKEFPHNTFFFNVTMRGTKPGAYIQYWDGLKSIDSLPYIGKKGEWETLSVEFTVNPNARFYRFYAAILGSAKGNEVPSIEIKDVSIQIKQYIFNK